MIQHHIQKCATRNSLAKAGGAETSNIAARPAFAVESVILLNHRDKSDCFIQRTRRGRPRIGLHSCCLMLLRRRVTGHLLRLQKPEPAGLTNCGTFPPFDFGPSLMQHSFALAAYPLLRCSACRRSSRSKASIWPDRGLHLHCNLLHRSAGPASAFDYR